MASSQVFPWLRNVAFFLISLVLTTGGARAVSLEESAASKSDDVSALHGARSEGGVTLSPWMSLSEMNAYLEGLDGDKPEGKNFWDRGNWINGVEGRWEGGIQQYRLSHSAVPAHRAYWWFWYVNQDREAFDRLVPQMADDGFALVQFKSYVRPGGSERFQGFWHQLGSLAVAQHFAQR